MNNADEMTGEEVVRSMDPAVRAEAAEELDDDLISEGGSSRKSQL